MKRHNAKWQSGDIFTIRLVNGLFATGQILDLQMPNVVRCLFYSDLIKSTDNDTDSLCKANHLISKLSISREKLDFGVWPIIGSNPIPIMTKHYPNEQFRAKGWVGAKIYDASIVEEFINAYFGLSPWDDWANPNYLDSLLIEKLQRPKNIILKGN